MPGSVRDSAFLLKYMAHAHMHISTSYLQQREGTGAALGLVRDHAAHSALEHLGGASLVERTALRVGVVAFVEEKLPVDYNTEQACE